MNFRPWLHAQFSGAQMDQAREGFIEARKLIEKYGWTSDWDRLQHGRIDLAAAVNRAAGVRNQPTFDSPVVIAEAILTRWLSMDIYTWNDNHARNKTHVIEILDGLIAVLTEEAPHGCAGSAHQEEEDRGRSSDHVGAH